MGVASLIAATGARVSQQILALGAYNISNKPSTAFKELTLNTASIVAQNTSDTGAGTPVSDIGNMKSTNTVFGLGVKNIGTSRNMQQGSARVTNNPTDVMIQGRGYFVVTRDDGKRFFTRDGNFKKNAQGQLVTLKGYTVSPGLAIPIDASAVSINESGEIYATVAGVAQLVGQLEIATFMNEDGLNEVGDNMYENTDPNDQPVIGNAGTDGRGTILQGALEESNVETINSLINVMNANITFGILMKIIEADKTQGEKVASAA